MSKISKEKYDIIIEIQKNLTNIDFTALDKEDLAIQLRNALLININAEIIRSNPDPHIRKTFNKKYPFLENLEVTCAVYSLLGDKNPKFKEQEKLIENNFNLFTSKSNLNK